MSLFPYQQVGVEWLRGRGFALLADEMGLGKTPQAICGADACGAKKVLVVCPAVARVNWAREFKLWGDEKRNIQVLVKTTERVNAANKDFCAVICSYDYASRNYPYLRDFGFDLLVVDETHFAKSIDAARTKAIFGVHGVVRGVKRIWCLSGTPAPNHAGELWVLLVTAGVTQLKYWEFVKRYCVVVEGGYGLRIVGTNTARIPELRALLARVMLRRMKKDVLTDLPPIFFSETVVEPGVVPGVDEELREKLQREEKMLVDALSVETMTDEQKLLALESLATSVSTLRRIKAMQKIEPVTELLTQELENGLYEKVVVFCVHRVAVESLLGSLKRYGAVGIYGDTPAGVRQKNIDRFQNDPNCRVFVGNIASCGTAITLTSAHHVVLFEKDWVPSSNAQAVCRCHRIGQKNSVTVREIVLDDPVDQKVTRVLQKKVRELTKIFDF